MVSNSIEMVIEMARCRLTLALVFSKVVLQAIGQGRCQFSLLTLSSNEPRAMPNRQRREGHNREAEVGKAEVGNGRADCTQQRIEPGRILQMPDCAACRLRVVPGISP